MKYSPLFLLASLSCVAPSLPPLPVHDPAAVDVDEDVANSLRGRAIKIILDTAMPRLAKNEKFVVLIPNDASPSKIFREAGFIAWFKFNCNNEHIIVNYLSFPYYEVFSDMYSIPRPENFSDMMFNAQGQNSDKLHFNLPRRDQFYNCLREILQNGWHFDPQNVKVLNIAPPFGLKTDDLINKMRKIDRTLYTTDDNGNKIGLAVIGLDSDNGRRDYVWGIKTADMEAIRDTFNYYLSSNYNAMMGIWDYIMYSIFEHETPGQWSNDYAEYKRKLRGWKN
jgi:hypothetical protein